MFVGVMTLILEVNNNTISNYIANSFSVSHIFKPRVFYDVPSVIFQDDDDHYQSGYDDHYQSGSFPKDFGYAPFDGETEGSMDPLAGEQKPRILLMGLRR